ncbi:MAG TPA: cytochrome c oxidase subunit II [Bdellovibrionota bacterium]|nr:cytochrome c oxidase subunit II [Bdellovibrionota bacterium]
MPRASTLASNIDALFNFIFWSSVVSFVLIVAALIFFTIHYHRRKRKEDGTTYIEGHGPTEFSVATLLTILVMVIFAWGWADYKKIIEIPGDALEINVIAHQWWWDFEYADGIKTRDELVVPLGKNIKLLMSSADVIHSFYIPDFRLKQDVVPGSYTTLWFNATQEGSFQVFCAEYCGLDHSQMLAQVKVMSPALFARWQRNKKKEESAVTAQVQALPVSPTVARGKKLYADKGCNACHSEAGQQGVGPTSLGAFGKERELVDGSKVKMDENYIRESMMEPNAKVVKGFPPVMPPFKGQLTDEDVNALVAYIKSLGDEARSAELKKQGEAVQKPVVETFEDKGEKIFNELSCGSCHSIEGEKSVGPALVGVYGTSRRLTNDNVMTSDGTYVKAADEEYLKDALLNPEKDVVWGYKNTMPSYKNELTEPELKALIEYLKGL